MTTHPILDECTKTEDGHYIHTKCGELLDAKTVLHPIWFRDFGHCTGSGDVSSEVIPFCGTCGPEPSSYGAPIYASINDVFSP